MAISAPWSPKGEIPAGTIWQVKAMNQYMQKRTVERNMFFNAKPDIFQKTEMLRKNMTKAEMKLWEKLRNKQLGVRFKAQHPMMCFIADFYCHKSRLVVEIDGDSHGQQKEYDIGRTTEMERFGIRVIRFSNEEVINSTEKVVEGIKDNL